VALVLTLLILTLLVVVGLELNRATRVEANLAGNFRDLTQASYIAQSGVEVARAILQEDNPLYDGPDSKWRQFEMLSLLSGQYFSEGNFTGKIEDEEGKFNPHWLTDPVFGDKRRKQFERLLTLLGYNPDKVVDPILDWLDPDDIKRPLGAERDYYLSLKPPYAPKNGNLDTLGEMLFIKGVDGPLFYGTEKLEGLQSQLSIHTNADGKININTVGPTVLMSLSPRIDLAMAQAVVTQRQQKPFRTPSDLQSLPGWGAVYAEINGQIKVSSNFFTISVNGFYRGAQATIQAVVKREGKKTQVVYWKAG
jgi:general secretion pathway protein K